METLEEAPEFQISAGLNRTMQYGNKYNGKHRSERERRFKSYYVVWKQQRVIK